MRSRSTTLAPSLRNASAKVNKMARSGANGGGQGGSGGGQGGGRLPVAGFRGGQGGSGQGH